jgi:predicted dehydrogenase
MRKSSSQKKTIRVAVAGIGARGVLWLIPSLSQRDDVEVVALCDVCLPKAEHAVRTLAPKARAFRTIEEAMREVPCDAVAVTTPDGHHAEAVRPALEAGKWVFCEKPLETTLEKCRAIIQADEAAGGRVFIGFNLRYSPVYEEMKAQIDRGAVGRILTIQMDEFYDGGRTYFRRWNRRRSESGGLWITKACHDFDLMAWLAGKMPRRVSAFSARSYYVPKPGAATQCRDCGLAPTCPDRAPARPDDWARIWEENGGPPYDLCLYTSDGDTFDHGMATVEFDDDIYGTYTCNVVSGITERRIRVSGTRGTLDGRWGGRELTLTRRDPTQVVTIPVGGGEGSHGGADPKNLEAFLAFVRGEVEPRCRPRAAALSVRMGLAATRSSDEGRVVGLDEFPL